MFSLPDQSGYFQHLFNHSPAPTWVVDISALKPLFDRARAAGVQDFQTHFESCPDQVRDCANLARIVGVNQACADFFKASSPSDISTHLPTYFQEESWTVFRACLSALAGGKLRFEIKAPLRDLAGQNRVVYVAMTVIPDFPADLSCVLVSFTDLSEREHLDAALRMSEERFRILLRDVPSISVQGYDANGDVIFWNEASTTLYGYSAEEVMGCHLTTLIIPPAMRPAVRGAIQHMVETLQPIPAGQLELIRKDGSTVTVFSSHCVMSIPGRGVELYCLDIDLSDLKRAEVRLNDQLAELRRWHEITLGREQRILDLKREVNELLTKANRPPRYGSAETSPEGKDPQHA
jgi:PAS domain S-box-containing protein